METTLPCCTLHESSIEFPVQPVRSPAPEYPDVGSPSSHPAVSFPSVEGNEPQA